ncbi:ArdC family protein [Tabrizicola soli]|uniref:ArdC family protein n=1 Tax=Tabrizicola soli TaxID=2185115 RepID=A0ABV7E204_9RHOB|nr:zincin-like metallopeptidase domain-containing protein [Tabrizicola soli]
MSAYQQITEKIAEAIRQGVDGSGYRMPWHNTGGRPVNIASQRAYRGINTLSLWASAQERGYVSSLWGTLKQWNTAGAKVRKGERASLIVFWKDLPRNEAPAEGEEDANKRFVLKTSYAFNADQVDGWEARAAEPNREPCAAERLVAAAGVDLRIGGGRAFYHTKQDFVAMPPLSSFFLADAYQSVLLHEAAHWTGHTSRLDRQFGQRFGDKAYAFEELVAELSAAFLCADLGVSNEPRADHAEYVASWLKVLQSDPRAVFTAAAKATKAADFLLSFQGEEEKSAA